MAGSSTDLKSCNLIRVVTNRVEGHNKILFFESVCPQWK